MNEILHLVMILLLHVSAKNSFDCFIIIYFERFNCLPKAG